MPDTQDAQVKLQAAYGVLDQLRDLLKTVQGDFRVPVGPGLPPAKLPPESVAALKAQYAQLVQQLDQTAKGFPDARAYFP